MNPTRKYHDGQRFGSWTVLVAYPGHGDARAKCRCDCGTVRMIPRALLHPDKAQRCRVCWLKELRNFKNGQRFGSWTIITAYPEPGAASAFCRCDCGREQFVQRGQLAYGYSTRCAHCRRDWEGRLLGKMIGGRRVIEVDGDQVVLECTKCQAKSVVTSNYARMTRATRAPTHTRCKHCEVSASREAIERTGVSRQAIHQRMAAGWSHEEATTTPKGQLPPRIAADRERAR